MITSGTDWVVTDQMSKLPASDQKQSLCNYTALKLLEFAGFITCHNATFSCHFKVLLGHSRVIACDAHLEKLYLKWHLHAVTS